MRHFLELMERSVQDEGALVEAYGLLDEKAQRALGERADRARALSGRAYEPWQMLVPGRFRLRFAPGPGGMRARIEGGKGVVVVTGEHPGQRAEVPLVREAGIWKVQLTLPPLRSEGDASHHPESG